MQRLKKSRDSLSQCGNNAIVLNRMNCNVVLTSQYRESKQERIRNSKQVTGSNDSDHKQKGIISSMRTFRGKVVLE